MTVFKTMVLICVLAGLLAGTVNAVTIATVPVGNPGNTADTRYNSISVGSVGYSYNIGKYEVTAGQYTEFLNAVAKTDTYGLYNPGMSNTDGSGITRSGGGTVGNPYTYSVASASVNRPVNYVSWGRAARFANWMSNGQPLGAQNASTTEDGSYFLNGAISNTALLAVTRKANATWVIPSEDEWYKAAYYKGGSTNAGYFDYQTSSDTAPGRDMTDASGNNANILGTPFPIDSGIYTTLGGEFQNSASPFGTFDQGGNVWEWTEAVIDSYRGIRGGAFNSNFTTLPASYRISKPPLTDDYNFGFRVSEVPEPATIVMLAIGAGLLVRRKRLGK